MCLDGPAIVTCKITMGRCWCIALVASVEPNFRRSLTWGLISDNCFKGVKVVPRQSEIVFNLRPVHEITSNSDILKWLCVIRNHEIRMSTFCIEDESNLLSIEHIGRDDIH